MPAIIINADDFGVSASVNTSIRNMFEKGIISSTSIMANGKSFDIAAQIALECPGLGIGVHLCLDGSYNIGKDYRSIMDRSTGSFFDHITIKKKASRFLVNETEIYKEYCLQIEKVLDHKIKVTHLDHHHHLHLYLSILKPMIRAARKYRIRHIRSQRILLHQHSFLQAFYREVHQAYLRVRIGTTDGYFEPHINERSDFNVPFDRLIHLLKLKGKVFEIILHPVSFNDPESSFFLDDRIRNLIAGSKIINYKDLNV